MKRNIIIPLVKSTIWKIATGYRINVSVETKIRFTLGHNKVQATVLVADIVEEIILG